MLTAIEARNFKCFGETGIRLELAPLTILVGPNGSGKSSALDAIALLAQTAPESHQQTYFKWEGHWVNLGADGIFAFHCGNTGARLRLGITFSNGESLLAWQQERGLFPEVPIQVSNFGYAVEHSGKASEWLHEISRDGAVVARNESRRTPLGLTAAGYQQALRYFGTPELERAEFRPQEVGAVLSARLFEGPLSAGTLDSTGSKQCEKLSGELKLLMAYMADSLRSRVFIVGAGRAITKSKPARQGGPLNVGRHGESTLPVLSVLFAKPEYVRAADRIRHWASVFGLESLRGGWAGQTHLEAGYTDPKSETPLPVQQAGFGSQQILPVITQLYCAPSGSLIMVEEPEISLHPEAQINLVKMFADAIEAGQQVMTTTHSQTLLLALPEAAKEHKLLPNQVAVYSFSREREAVKAIRLELDSSWYVKGWVPSFSDVESRLIQQWIVNVRDKITTQD